MKKYQIIYADPPWRYVEWHRQGGSRGLGRCYENMRLTDILNLPVYIVADIDCILFLWAICPLLPEAFEVIRRWKFYYRTVGFTWIKENKKSNNLFWGMGGWTRANPEVCLLSTKGNPQRISKSVHSVIYSKIRGHSQKPDETREKIIELCGDLPRIELFARQKTPGWDVWGDEVESDICLNTTS